MKLKALLLIGGLLTAMSASAELTIKKVDAPKVVTTAPVFDGETEQYLYNIGTNSFFLGANDWETRGSVSATKGYRVKLEYTETAFSGSFLIRDYVEKFNNWLCTFVADADGIWVDNNTGDNFDTWMITFSDDTQFAIFNGAFGEDQVLGAWSSGEDTRLYLRSKDTEGFSYLWSAVSTEEYSKYINLLTSYNSMDALYTKLMEADEAGIEGLEQYVAVYENAESTNEDRYAAADAVNELIVNAAAAKATAENPADVSNKLNNPTLNDNTNGWEGTALVHGYAGGEHYNKTFDTYQKVSGMLPGVYSLSVQGFYRSGSISGAYTNFIMQENYNAYVYAINFDENENDTVTTPLANPYEGIQPGVKIGDNHGSSKDKEGNEYFIPNNMATTAQYFNEGYYDNKVFFDVTQGTIQVGIKKTKQIDTDWTMINGFVLTYYGGGADAYKMWYDDMVQSLPVYDEEDQISESALEEYNAAVEAAKAAIVTNKAEVEENYNTVYAAFEKANANVMAWKALLEQYSASMIVVANPEMAGEDMDILADFILDVEDVINELSLSTEEVIALTAELATKTSNAIQNAIKPGTAYDQLKNVDFANGFQNWTVEAVSGGNVAANTGARCAEAWNNANFDIYQIIENAPVGCYEISLQGFYRRGRGDAAWLYYFDSDGVKRTDIPEVPVYVYMNANKTPIAYVFDYQVAYSEDGDGNENHLYAGTDFYKDPLGEYVYPNAMNNAGYAFDQGAYKVSAFGLVAKKGDALRVGVKGCANQDNDSWPIFTRFSLVYQGFEASIIKPELQKAIAALTENIKKSMGADVIVKADALATNGSMAYGTDDGKVMFDALAAIYEYNDTIEASVSLFTELKNAIEEIVEYAPEAPNAKIKEEAIGYAESVLVLIESGTMTDTDALKAIDTIADYMTVLGYPADYENASDTNPADFTAVIKSPSFEKDGVNSIDGWTASGYNFGNDDTQKSALALEYYQKNFDMYQTVGVPNGTYQVTSKAFSRHSDGAQYDYKLWTEGTPADARMYAKSGENTVEVNLEHQGSIPSASLEAIGGANFTTSEEVTYYVPNSMIDFRTFIDEDANRYNNSVIIKVVDETLTIGFKCDATNEWVIMDDVTLTYFGTNSEKEQTGWTTNIELRSAAPAMVEFFQLTGAKANEMKKGFNIVRTTDANGNVKVQKVVVK